MIVNKQIFMTACFCGALFSLSVSEPKDPWSLICGRSDTELLEIEDLRKSLWDSVLGSLDVKEKQLALDNLSKYYYQAGKRHSGEIYIAFRTEIINFTESISIKLTESTSLGEYLATIRGRLLFNLECGARDAYRIDVIERDWPWS
jgi:hypothetical protein